MNITKKTALILLTIATAQPLHSMNWAKLGGSIKLNLANAWLGSYNRYNFLNAIENNDFEAIQYLIECHADVNNAVNSRGITPIILACQYGNLKIIQYLLEEGAKANISECLMEACNGYAGSKVIEYLVEKGANINWADKEGRTPLFWACYSGNINRVSYFIKHGADVNHVSYEGKTPLFYAMERDRVDIVKCLVENGANINHVNNEGETPLHEACFWHHKNTIRYLVEQGAHLNRVNNKGETAVDRIRYRSNPTNALTYLKNCHDYIKQGQIVDPLHTRSSYIPDYFALAIIYGFTKDIITFAHGCLDFHEGKTMQELMPYIQLASRLNKADSLNILLDLITGRKLHQQITIDDIRNYKLLCNTKAITLYEPQPTLHQTIVALKGISKTTHQQALYNNNCFTDVLFTQVTSHKK